MNFVWAVTKREVRSYFVSPLAYTAMAVFLIIEGVLFKFSLTAYETSRTLKQLTQMPGPEVLVRGLLSTDITWALLLIVPLLTMRLLADERRQHTAELLLTAPMRTFDMVVGKWLGSAFVLLLMLVLTLWMPLVLVLWGKCDWAPILTGYLGALLYGGFLLALGLFASSLTESPMVSAMLSLLFVAIVNVAGMMMIRIPYLGQSLDQFTPQSSLERLATGVVDSQAIIFFLSVTVFLLDLTARAVDSQRWR